jgi:hypothetical protein
MELKSKSVGGFIQCHNLLNKFCESRSTRGEFQDKNKQTNKHTHTHTHTQRSQTLILSEGMLPEDS